MAFLDNSGDIILDAVLTDTGRMRLAKGDGSFKITQFALGDDEIDYGLYDANHTSGSAYYDLQVLQLPVLEAFTDNAAGLKSKLITVSNNNLLYLPVIQLNEIWNGNQTARHGDGVFMVAVDETTEKKFLPGDHLVDYGENLNQSARYIRLDQGLDTTAFSPQMALPADLQETQYIVEIDTRFGQIYSWDSHERASISFIDDDNIATYYLSLGANNRFVMENEVKLADSATQVCDGPRGTILQFKIKSSLELNDSTQLFTELGGDNLTVTDIGGTSTYYFLDTFVKIQGATTGYRADIPVRFIKLKSD
tara:strand:+ start:1170 stop:2093 length:924 start_codon:yes stop_codon:yes gene_type:complete